MVDCWIIPCNTKYFDVNEHFKKTDIVVWKNSFTIHEGDIAYIYLGSPYGEIRYKCIVECSEVSESLLKDHSYAIVEKKSNNYYTKKTKYIQMRLLGCFPEKTLPYSLLKENGLGQVQIQARASRQLKSMLEKYNNYLVCKGDL